MSEENLLTAEIEVKEAKVNSKKPVGLPDKFWDGKKEAIRTDALLSSYLALEKKLSGMLPYPENDDDKRRVEKALGVPDRAEDYDLSVPNDLFEIDPELNKRLLAKGFTQAQAQEVYDLAAEKLVPLIIEMAAEFQADREIEKLVAHFGGADKWREISKQLLAYGRKNLPADVLDGLSCSYEGVMALARMMKSDQPAMKSDNADTHAGEDDLYAMMKNPKYWREKDPSFVAKVTQGFEKLYASK